MSKTDIIRAWKDEEYRQSLTDAERATLPENPAGKMELTDADLGSVVGGTDAVPPMEGTNGAWTFGCCTNVMHGCGASWQLGTYGCCPVY